MIDVKENGQSSIMIHVGGDAGLGIFDLISYYYFIIFFQSSANVKSDYHKEIKH